MPDDYVTIANYPSPVEAHLAKVALEASQIQTFIMDSATAGLLPHIPELSYVRLQVHKDDAKRAVEILSSETTVMNDDNTEVDAATPDDEPVTVSSTRISECPSCGSERIEVTQSVTRALFGAVYAFFVLSTLVVAPKKLTRHWRCLHCGHRWEAP